MAALRFRQPDDDATLRDWQHVHNVIIPTHTLSLDEVRDRARRHHLEIAYLDGGDGGDGGSGGSGGSGEDGGGGDLVGCSTVRPPTDETRTATVIARVLAPHRGRGFGRELYARGLDRARELGAEVIETVVLSSNEDGLRFALRHGFAETERYVLPGETVPWIDLRLGPPAA